MERTRWPNVGLERARIDRTFKRCADDYISAHRAAWRNARHAEQWTTTLHTYCFPHFGDKHVADVGKADILAAIEPQWTTKNETMSRLRGRVELILSCAMQRGDRPEGPNPARWRGNLDAVLPKPSKVNNRAHHEALPIDSVREFGQRLRGLDGMSARALEFQLLTAARSGEVSGALWDEIDLVGETWTVAAARMKGGREHRVPLSPQAVALLESLPRLEDSPLVFPGRSAKPLSDMSLTACMRRMGLTAVPHGLRSTFRDWIAERTSYPNEMAELALAHTVRDKTEAAYRRGNMFDKRRKMMADWAGPGHDRSPTRDGFAPSQLARIRMEADRPRGRGAGVPWSTGRRCIRNPGPPGHRAQRRELAVIAVVLKRSRMQRHAQALRRLGP